MPARTLMIQGTGSHVGKSVLVAALCRLFRRRGLRVAPFKAQNMSNNSFVTPDGREIGRAQALQAFACGLPSRSDFNPVLIKPTGDRTAQLVVEGRVAGTLHAADFGRVRRECAAVAARAFARLAAEFDLVILEGAGSPAEINLRKHDLANMYMAGVARAPVLLVGDIDRGGVFAALVGTLALLEPEERRYVKAVLINKFRGDISLLAPGLEMLRSRTGVDCLGVVPHCGELLIPEEDGLGWEERRRGAASRGDSLVIAVADLPAISNATDLEALGQERDVQLVRVAEDLHQAFDALILPGTKHTAGALRFVRERGVDRLAGRLAADKKTVVGICGGYQILGRRIRDPRGVESSVRDLEGLGLLDVTTTFGRKKIVVEVTGRELETGHAIQGYQVHMGRTRLGPGVLPWLQVEGRGQTWHDGARSTTSEVYGTYVHGLFDSPAFRRAWLDRLRSRRGWAPLGPTALASVEERLDAWADVVARHVDLDRIETIVSAGVAR